MNDVFAALSAARHRAGPGGRSQKPRNGLCDVSGVALHASLATAAMTLSRTLLLPIINLETCAEMKRSITVNDQMQQDYRYERVEPAGRNFHPEFKPDLTSADMLCLGVFGGKYMTDCGGEFPETCQACEWNARPITQLLRRRCQSAALGMAPERLDIRRRSTRLVPMVLPVLHGATNARRERSADQTLEGNPPACASAPACVRACLVPQAATAGAAALGLRQPQAVREDRDHRVGEFVRPHLAISSCGVARGAGGQTGATLRGRGLAPMVPYAPSSFGGYSELENLLMKARPKSAMEKSSTRLRLMF
jgi:hypothetical protein